MSTHSHRIPPSRTSNGEGPSRFGASHVAPSLANASRFSRPSDKNKKKQSRTDDLFDASSDDDHFLPTAAQPQKNQKRVRLGFDKHLRLRELGSQEVPKQFPDFPVLRAPITVFDEDEEGDPFLQDVVRPTKRTRGRKRVSASTDIRNVDTDELVDDFLADAKALRDWGKERSTLRSKSIIRPTRDQRNESHAARAKGPVKRQAPRRADEDRTELRDCAGPSEVVEARRALEARPAHEAQGAGRLSESPDEEANLSGTEEPTVAVRPMLDDGGTGEVAEQDARAEQEARKRAARALTQLPSAQIALRHSDDDFEEDDELEKETYQQILQERRAERKEHQRRMLEEVDRLAEEDRPERERRKRDAERQRRFYHRHKGDYVGGAAESETEAEDGDDEEAREEEAREVAPNELLADEQDDPVLREQEGGMADEHSEHGQERAIAPLREPHAEREGLAVGNELHEEDSTQEEDDDELDDFQDEPEDDSVEEEEPAPRVSVPEAQAIRGGERRRIRLSEHLANGGEGMSTRHDAGQQSTSSSNRKKGNTGRGNPKEAVYKPATPDKAAAKRTNEYAVRQEVVGRTPWTKDEVACLMESLDYIYTELYSEKPTVRQYAEILKMHGPEGTISRRLAGRNNIQLKDKVRNEVSRRIKKGLPVPSWVGLQSDA